MNKNDLSSEISFISSNFSLFINKFTELGKDDRYYNLIESIVKNENLRLHNEDELLLFIINICEENNIYEILFEYVMLEYCSVETIKQFIEYINKYICKDYHHKSILKCIKRRLIQERIPLEKYDDEQRYTKLPDIFESIQKGKLIEVQYLIEKQDIDIDIKGEYERTPLHYACEKGHLQIVEYLISKGANINAKD